MKPLKLTLPPLLFISLHNGLYRFVMTQEPNYFAKILEKIIERINM